MNDVPPGSSRAIAERLETLFATVRSPSGGAYTDEEIAARATARGFEMSRPYIQQLRRGRRANPTVRALEGLAAAALDPWSVQPARIFDRVGYDSDRSKQDAS